MLTPCELRMRRVVEPDPEGAEYAVTGCSAPQMNISTPFDARAAVRQTIESALRALHAAGDESLEGAARVLAFHGRRLLDCDCLVSVVDPARPDRLLLVAGAGPWAETLVGRSYPLEGSFQARAMARRKAVTSDDLARDSPFADAFREGGITCGLAVPLPWRGPLPDERRDVGVLGFWRSERRRFELSEVAAAQEFVDVAGAALTSGVRLRAYRAAAEHLSDEVADLEHARARMRLAHTRAIEALASVSRHVDAGGSVAEFFGQMSQTVAALVDAERVGFARLTPRGSLRPQRHGYGISDRDMRGFGELRIRPSGRRGMERVVNEGVTARLRIADIPPHDMVAPAALHALATRDLMMTRWSAGERTLGVLAAYDCRHPGGFTDEDASVLEICARATGLVWEQVRSRRRAHSAEARRVAQMAEHVERMRSIVGSALDAIVTMDDKGRIVDLNHAAVELFGFDAAAAIGHEVAQLIVPPELRERHRLALRRQAASGEGGILFRRLDAPALRADGTTFDAEVAVVRTQSEGRPLYVGFVRDVTELRRAAEREREQAARVAGLERAKTRLLNLASHELRGPLGVLNGYLAMIEEGALGEVPEELRQVVPLLRSKVNEMNVLVDGMLDAARIDDAHLRLTTRLVDMHEVVDRAIAQVAAMHRDRKRIRLKTPSEPVTVLGDDVRLGQVVGNLVHNALKYSPGGQPVLVDLLVDDDDAVLRVTDHGIGIDPADMARLFTRFGRIVNSRNSHIPGTGLGLYLARELARMHGGDIGVTSTPRVGSVFSLSLPLAGS